jgi:TRAP-type mannitol/chloroaromatic compound transport system substrate-binding protein
MFWDLAGGGRELSFKMVKDLPVQFIGPLTVHPAEVWAQSKKPLNTLADIKGLKIRLGSAPLAEIYQRMGAAPVVLSGAEIYESAKRGVIDAFEYVTPSINYSMAFHEVTEYLYLSPVRAPADRQSVWVTKDAWNKLSPALQKLVLATAEALVPKFFAETMVKDAEALDKMKAYGTKILPVPKEIDDELIKVANKYFDELSADDAFFKEVIDSQRKFKALADLQGVR